MPTWMIDAVTREGQQVLPTCPSSKTDQRFRKINADRFTEAVDKACMERTALIKLEAIKAGGEAIMSDKELDWLIDQELYPLDVVSIPNPQRMGVWDTYLVAGKGHPQVIQYAAKIQAEYEARPEIQAYRAQIAA